MGARRFLAKRATFTVEFADTSGADDARCHRARRFTTARSTAVRRRCRPADFQRQRQWHATLGGSRSSARVAFTPSSSLPPPLLPSRAHDNGSAFVTNLEPCRPHPWAGGDRSGIAATRRSPHQRHEHHAQPGGDGDATGVTLFTRSSNSGSTTTQVSLTIDDRRSPATTTCCSQNQFKRSRSHGRLPKPTITAVGVPAVSPSRQQQRHRDAAAPPSTGRSPYDHRQQRRAAVGQPDLHPDG